MTRTFGTNANSDIYIGRDGNLVVLDGIEAVSAACETATYAIIGEMIYSENRGIPYFETVWVGSPNYAIFRTYLINTLLSVDGVLNVQELSLAVDSGVLSYSATILTRFGVAALNGTTGLNGNSGITNG